MGGYGNEDLRVGVYGPGFRVSGLLVRVLGAGSKIEGLGSRASG